MSDQPLSKGTLIWSGEHWINYLRLPGAADDSANGEPLLYSLQRLWRRQRGLGGYRWGGWVLRGVYRCARGGRIYPGKYDKNALLLIEDARPDLFICGHSHILKVY